MTLAPLLARIILSALLLLPAPAGAAAAGGLPEERFFEGDYYDYILAVEVIDGKELKPADNPVEAYLKAARAGLNDAKELLARSSEEEILAAGRGEYVETCGCVCIQADAVTAFQDARSVMFRCVYAWILLQDPAGRPKPEQREAARVLLGELREFFGWDAPTLERVSTRVGTLLQEVLTAREAREHVRQGLDPKEEAAAKALEKQ
jgi:hypothetical protein